MSQYVFIESRDPFTSNETGSWFEMIENLRQLGQETSVVLLQNGVFSLRQGATCNALVSKLIHNQVKVIADEFALKERGITQLVDGVQVMDMDQLTELMLAPQTKAIWH